MLVLLQDLTLSPWRRYWPVFTVWSVRNIQRVLCCNRELVSFRIYQLQHERSAVTSSAAW